MILFQGKSTTVFAWLMYQASVNSQNVFWVHISTNQAYVLIINNSECLTSRIEYTHSSTLEISIKPIINKYHESLDIIVVDGVYGTGKQGTSLAFAAFLKERYQDIFSIWCGSCSLKLSDEATTRNSLIYYLVSSWNAYEIKAAFGHLNDFEKIYYYFGNSARDFVACSAPGKVDQNIRSLDKDLSVVDDYLSQLNGNSGACSSHIINRLFDQYSKHDGYTTAEFAVPRSDYILDLLNDKTNHAFLVHSYSKLRSNPTAIGILVEKEFLHRILKKTLILTIHLPERTDMKLTYLSKHVTNTAYFWNIEEIQLNATIFCIPKSHKLPLTDFFHVKKTKTSTVLDLFQITINLNHKHKFSYLESYIEHFRPTRLRFFIVYPHFVEGTYNHSPKKFPGLTWSRNSKYVGFYQNHKVEIFYCTFQSCRGKIVESYS